jgi:transmembrane sensor
VKNLPDMAEPDPLVDEALDCIVRLKTGEPTRAEVDALQHWRDQSPAHEQAFQAAARLWRHMRIAAQELAEQELAEEEQTAAARRGRARAPRLLSRRMMILGGSVAVAAAAGYAVVVPPFDLWPSLNELSADYRTAKGERRKVVLASDVWLELNTQTSVALRPAQNETAVELISGEASVVAKLPSSSRPFVMLAANGRVTAARADFNARCLGGVVAVACLDGVVDIELANKSVRLQKAEQVSYSSAGFAESANPADIAQVAAWQGGLLIFRDRPLGDVVDEVNRYRLGKIIITNEAIKRRIVNGTFQIDKLGNFVPQVQQLFGARVTSLPGGVVLLS